MDTKYSFNTATSHQKQSAATRKQRNPNAFREMGRVGARARHSKTHDEEREIAQRAAKTRLERDRDAFIKMGRAGGKAPHSVRGRGKVQQHHLRREEETSVS